MLDNKECVTYSLPMFDLMTGSASMQKRIVNKLALTAVCGLFCVDAMAIAPGLYMGLMMGPASNTGSEQPMQVLNPATGLPPSEADPTAVVSLSNPKSSQFGSRLYLGYKFNQYAGFEGGFTYFSGISYVLKDSTLTPAAGTTGRVRAIDFLGKLDYSYNNTIGIFGKFGVSATYTTTPGALNITNYRTVPVPVSPTYPTGQKPAQTTGSNTYTVKLSPTFAVGASYDLNQSWQIDATWTRYLVGGSISGMNLYALGISYHFVDVYCGQFLCSD
jgi:hypothetical protein